MPNKRIVTKKVRNDGTTVKTVSRQKQNKDGTTSYTEKIKRKGKDGKRISKVKSKGTYNTKTGKTISDTENIKKYKAGGSLKSVPKSNKGLSKLPKSVRNKMGYAKKGKEMKDYYGGGSNMAPAMDKRGRRIPGMFQDGGTPLIYSRNDKLEDENEMNREMGTTYQPDVPTTQITPNTNDSRQAPNWNKKLSRLTDKRTKRKGKGKSTTGVQKRINKAMKKAGN